MPKSRIIHLSDLHFAENPKNQRPSPSLSGTPYSLDVHSETIANALWKEIVRLLKEVKSSLLVVSGDLTSRGGKSQFEVVLTYLLSHFRWGYNHAERFGISGDDEDPLQSRDDEKAPYLLVPGNHDAWGGGLNIISLRNQTQFVKNYTRIRAAYSPPLFPAVRTLTGNSPSLIIFGLDSALPKPWNFARGKVEKDQLKKIYDRSEREERNLGEPPLKIAVIHHAVASSSTGPGGSLIALENQPEVEKWLIAAGINMALSGHLHKDYLDPPPLSPSTPPLVYPPFSLGRQILYSGVGTATAFPTTSSSVNSFKAYDFDGKTVVVRSFQFNAGPPPSACWRKFLTLLLFGHSCESRNLCSACAWIPACAGMTAWKVAASPSGQRLPPECTRFVETTPSPLPSYSLTPLTVGARPLP